MCLRACLSSRKARARRPRTSFASSNVNAATGSAEESAEEEEEEEREEDSPGGREGREKEEEEEEAEESAGVDKAKSRTAFATISRFLMRNQDGIVQSNGAKREKKEEL